MGRKSLKRPEIWGGIECSYNRVGGLYMDQLLQCGHYARVNEDIEAIASLGVRSLRYPVIWERLKPSQGHTIDWSTVEVPLALLRHYGINPVVGLVHHGSGPLYADLLDPSFATGLSAFAGKVAERFPWLDHYAPVNEPLTTARFSALYGTWFPHRRSDRAFAHTLVNQMKAVVLSMQEIRKVNPRAKLVQTEDLAKVYSTTHLQYQADFENHRRWLTWDLLCGRMNREHALWDYFIGAGVSETALRFFTDHPCPPDIIGVDYYATSERYLDEALERYPPHTHGGNHFERYADVEAVRVRHCQPTGFKLLLKECWERYGLPIAITETHINCDFENQIRWFSEIYHTSGALLNKGIDIRSVTAWALLGAFGWNTLLTKAPGDYESGVFDVRSGVPIPTPLSEYITRLAQDPAYIHPAETEQGWWRRDDRFIWECAVEDLVGRV